MPAQEVQQPQPIQMVAPQPMDATRVSSEQPVRPSLPHLPSSQSPNINEPPQRPTEQMTAEPVRMRGGEAGDVCCGM
jgi:hypothetical protein